MFKTKNDLPQDVRSKTVALLNSRLADCIDLQTQTKQAHWNVKGPHFAALHPLFETFAVSLANHNDSIAERAVTLGAHVYGTVRHAAKASSLPEYEAETRRDLDHVRLLADRIEAYLKGLRETRDLGETEDDQDTVDLLTGIIEEFEKHGWFLRATLEG